MFELKLPWPFAPIGFPIVDWLPQYTKSLLLADLSAGLTVFIFLIPQGMAYALLAGMPPIYGLYSAIIPLYLYTIFGTSRQLAIGPMAITSLLLGVSVQSSGFEEQSSEYITAVLNLSLVVGILMFILGLFRMGMLANLISGSVLTGFLTASALVIALNQVKYIFGLNVPRFPYTVQTIAHILTHLHETNGSALVMGALCIALLYSIKLWRLNNKPTPERMQQLWFRIAYNMAKLASFIVIVVTSFIAKALIDGGLGLDVVGAVPSGLQPPTFSPIGIQDALQLIPSSLAIAFVAFAGNWAVAKKYSLVHKYEVSANQELLAEGLCVTVGVFFNSFAVSGGLARSAVNAESGAMTQIASVVVASLMLLAVQFLTSLFFYIPMTVLGSIIEVSVVSMVDFEEMHRAYKVHKKDFIVMVCTFLFTFFVGVSEGLFVGIAISIAMILHSTAFPHVVHLGKLPENEGGHYKDVSRYPYAVQFPGTAIIRMDATLFFGNCAHFKDLVLRAAEGEFHSHPDVPITKVVIDATSWIDLDLSAVKALAELKDQLTGKRGITIAIAAAICCVRDKLRDSQYLPNAERLNYDTHTVTEAMQRSYALNNGTDGSDSCDAENAVEGGGEVAAAGYLSVDQQPDSIIASASADIEQQKQHEQQQQSVLDMQPEAKQHDQDHAAVATDAGHRGHSSFGGNVPPEVELSYIPANSSFGTLEDGTGTGTGLRRRGGSHDDAGDGTGEEGEGSALHPRRNSADEGAGPNDTPIYL